MLEKLLLATTLTFLVNFFFGVNAPASSQTDLPVFSHMSFTLNLK